MQPSPPEITGPLKTNGSVWDINHDRQNKQISKQLQTFSKAGYDVSDYDDWLALSDSEFKQRYSLETCYKTITLRYVGDTRTMPVTAETFVTAYQDSSHHVDDIGRTKVEDEAGFFEAAI